MSDTPRLSTRFRRAGGHENDTGTRLRQTPVDLPQERLAKHDVLLAEPNRDALGYEQVVQFRSNTASVIPRVAEEDITKIGLLTSAQLDSAADGSQRPQSAGV